MVAMKTSLLLVMGIVTSLIGCKSPKQTPVASPVENDTIVYFSLSEGGGMNRFSGFRYEVNETNDGKVHFLFNEGYPDEKEFTIDDHSVFDSLQAIIQQQKVYTWSGHYQPEFDILDGTSWSLYVKYKSRKSISAGGYMAGPDGYWVAFNDFIRCLDNWKKLPIAVNEVVRFTYDYGPSHYTVERKEDHGVLTYDNDETGEHQVLERDLQMLEDLRITFNVGQLKMDGQRGKIDFDCTLWMYDITYSNGEHYHYESYDRDYKCGYTNMIQAFIETWMKDDPERRPMYYYFY